jgi:hypothetical protein
MDDTTSKVADRRNFIKLAGATAAGAGATVATAGVAAAKTVEARPADAMYRETDHVKRYYELAR